MVQRPGADIPAIDLPDAVAGHPGAGATGGEVGKVLDKQALSAYRRRPAEIDADLDEARSGQTAAGPRSWRPNAMRCWARCARRPDSAAARACPARCTNERALPSERR
jgi:hypothetical protein